MTTTYDSPFSPVVKMWTAAIKRAGEHRWNEFGKVAKICRGYFDGSCDFLYKRRTDGIGLVVSDGIAAPQFQYHLNKVAELVQLFGPTIYHANPYRHVKPRRPVLTEQQLTLSYGPEFAPAVAQMLQQRRERDEIVAGLQSAMLNYTPGQLDLKGHSRRAITEALVAGRGVLWHEMYRPGPNSPHMVPFSYFGSWEDLYIDPDAESFAEATWIMQRTRMPRWRAERDYGLRQGSLEGYAKGESHMRQAQVDATEHGDYQRKRGETSDQVTIYKIWSKCGLGHNLSSPNGDVLGGMSLGDLRDGLSRFGDEVFLVLCEGCNWPLNVPPEEVRADEQPYTAREVWERTRWPVPFYEDSDGWPATPLDFHVVPQSAWPMAHFKPALAEMAALSWIYSFLMGRVHITSRTLIFVAAHLSEKVRDAFVTGRDLEIVDMDELVRDIDLHVKQFEHKEAHVDLWKLAQELNMLIDKRVGTMDLLYGQTDTQLRSATESQVKQQQLNIRPAAMADTAEDWASIVARKEALMMRWKMPGAAVSAFMGEQTANGGVGMFGELWDRFVAVPLDYANPDTLSRPCLEYEYTIAAGSVRKPDLAKDQTDMDTAIQTMLPIADAERQQSGDPSLANTLLQAWAASHQMDGIPLLPDRRAEMQAQQQAMQEQQMMQQQGQMPQEGQMMPEQQMAMAQ